MMETGVLGGRVQQAVALEGAFVGATGTEKQGWSLGATCSQSRPGHPFLPPELGPEDRFVSFISTVSWGIQAHSHFTLHNPKFRQSLVGKKMIRIK